MRLSPLSEAYSRKKAWNKYVCSSSFGAPNRIVVTEVQRFPERGGPDPVFCQLSHENLTDPDKSVFLFKDEVHRDAMLSETLYHLIGTRECAYACRYES